MTKTLIIAFVGMPGSGKGTCTDYLAEKHGWPLLHFGNMVYEEVQKRGLHNTKDEKFVRKDMRDKGGPAVLAKKIAEKIEEQHTDKKVVLLDGLYSWSEYKFLEEKFGKAFITIALAAPKELRRKRVLNRKDSHRKYTLDVLMSREIDEIENLEKGGPIAYADFTLVNNSNDKEDLFSQLEQVLKQLDIT
jgi:dephospho-CoA kinase